MQYDHVHIMFVRNHISELTVSCIPTEVMPICIPEGFQSLFIHQVRVIAVYRTESGETKSFEDYLVNTIDLNIKNNLSCELTNF